MAAVARLLDGAARADAPPHLHAREVLLGGAAYAGAIAVRDDREPDLVALFMPDSGWTTFASDEALLSEVRHRLAVRGPGGAPGVGDDAFDDAQAFDDIALRDVTGAPFETMASRILEVQRQHVATAWDDYRLDGATDDAATRRNDRLREAARLDTYLDLHGVLSRRDERLVEHLHSRRLARAPSAVARAWRDARTAYRRMLEDAGDLRQALGDPQALELAGFAQRELGAKLQDLGIQDDPLDIRIRVTQRAQPGTIDHAAGVLSGPATVETSLVELALRGLGPLDHVALTALGRAGQPLSAPLEPSALRAMLAALDLPNRYKAHLEDTLRGSPAASLARARAVDRTTGRPHAVRAGGRTARRLRPHGDGCPHA